MSGWKSELISEEDFFETWGAHVHRDGNMFTFRDVKEQPLHQVWSITDSGGDKPDHWIASPGFHVVNVLGYVMTRKPWVSKTPDAFYSFDDFEWDDVEADDEQA